jgi:hypothetical protein
MLVSTPASSLTLCWNRHIESVLHFYNDERIANEVIFYEESSVIWPLLEHLNLWKDLRHSPEPLELVFEPFADGIP